MSKLNRLICAVYRKNVGYGTCPFNPDLIVTILLFGTERVFTDAELDELEQILRDLAVSDSKDTRMYPVKNIVDIADNTEDETIETTGYGSKFLVRDGDYDITFRLSGAGGVCLQNALSTFNGPTPFLLVDKQGRIIGTKKNGKLATIPPQFFYAKNIKLPTGSTGVGYYVRISFFSKYISKDIAFVKADFDVDDIDGLQDLKIVQNSFDSETGELNISLLTDCGSVNVGETYNEILSANPSLFIATNGETGVDIAVTSATWNAGTKTFDVVLDIESGGYPEDGTGILFNLDVVSVLSAAGIDGYEATEIELDPESSSS